MVTNRLDSIFISGSTNMCHYDLAKMVNSGQVDIFNSNSATKDISGLTTSNICQHGYQWPAQQIKQCLGKHLYYSLREKCLYSEFLWTVFSNIRTEYGEIRRKYGPEKFLIWTHFTMTQIISFFNLTRKLTNFSSVLSFIQKLSFALLCKTNDWFLYEANTDL